MARGFFGNFGGGRSVSRALGFGSSIPPVTSALILICLAVYVLEIFIPSIGNAFVFAPIIGASEPYRFLTAAFLHSGLWHIIFNMYALALLGTSLEPFFGTWRFLALYLVSAVGGNVCVLLLASSNSYSWITGTVGASGAVFGLFGALLILTRRIGADTKGILVIIALNLLIGFLPGSHISWQGHLGGLIAGTAVTFALVGSHSHKIFRRTWNRIKTPIRSVVYDVSVFIVSVVVLAALIIWAYH